MAKKLILGLHQEIYKMSLAIIPESKEVLKQPHTDGSLSKKQEPAEPAPMARAETIWAAK